MELQLSGLLARSVAAIAAFTVYNFVVIYPASKAIMFDPGSWRKAANISTEFGFLSTVYAGLAYFVLDIAGKTFMFSTDSVFSMGAIAGYLFVVEMFRIWYIRREYDTTTLYAFIVAEAIPLAVLMAYLFVSSAVNIPA